MSSLFISHSLEDVEVLGPLLAQLDALSLRYSITGQHTGLEKFAWFLLAMTPRSAAAEHVKDELQWALTHRNGRIVPVIVEECEPTDFHVRLQRLPCIDLTPGNKKGLSQLQQTLQLVHDENNSLPSNTRKLDSDLEMISLLLTFISRNHQKHIRNLLPKSGADLSSYMGCASLRQELRDLCAWRLLKLRPTAQFGDLAPDHQRFNLKDVVMLTDLGKQVAAHVS